MAELETWSNQAQAGCGANDGAPAADPDYAPAPTRGLSPVRIAPARRGARGRPVDGPRQPGPRASARSGITADAHLVVVRLAPGGVIGRHPAAGAAAARWSSSAATPTVSGSTTGSARTSGRARPPSGSRTSRTRPAPSDGLTALVVEGDLDIGGLAGADAAVDAP